MNAFISTLCAICIAVTIDVNTFVRDSRRSFALTVTILSVLCEVSPILTSIAYINYFVTTIKIWYINTILHVEILSIGYFHPRWYEDVVHVYVVIQFCDSIWSFWVEANLCRVCIVCLCIYCCWRSSYQEGGLDRIYRFNPARTLITNGICRSLFSC